MERNRRLSNKRVVSSLMLDLIRGMIYLHQQIQVPDTKRVHGNLKSTNCLVDSYWNLKLTDFGLQQWRPNVKDDEDTHYLSRFFFIESEL
jgi:serine/threonine protein kinase